ncbi:MAG: hypothetical protein JNK63_06445 [Chthonomonas sp.]|nr:hypothetical protein [Chthonomonas sp.]
MRAEREALDINGGHGEGGGALFRTALAMSALTQTPVRIHQIRAATRKPGISPEDLTFIRMVETVSNADLKGDDLGSNELTFCPRRAPKPLTGSFDVQSHQKGSSPGNALMLADSILPVLARTGAYSAFSLHGETYNNHTLTYDAFSLGTLELHARQGVVAFSRQKVAGFGFAGLGSVEIEVEPSAPHGFQWAKRGELRAIRGIVAYQGMSKDVPERARDELMALVPENLDVEIIQVESHETGIHITLVADFETGLGIGACMGAKGIDIEAACRSALASLREFTDTAATLDAFLADQALISAALASEPTLFVTPRITPRLQTMAYIIRQFIPIPITILGRLNDVGTVKVG